MRLLGLKTFRHGIHPPESKDETSGLPIRQFPFAPLLIVPLVQHLGKPSLPVVRRGRRWRAASASRAPTASCRWRCTRRPRAWCAASGSRPSISGRMVPAVFLEPHPGSTQEVLEGTPCPLDTATPDEIIAAIQDAGVVGLGGAAFPTHVKLKIPRASRSTR